MAKIVCYKLLLCAVAMFVIAIGPSLLTSAFALTVSNGYYSHSHVTALTDPNLVCGNQLCTPGEMPHHPIVVVPAKGIQ
ncbi:MAG: hypothetical protein WAN47_00120 [Nitrosotalea sp.]